MAKQSGIHQIRGKVGGRSYYRTKGVEEGLSRSINQGISARVKTGDEYANTRLNNAEFKNANAIATAAFNSVNTRKRGMMRNFAISAMTKAALADIKQGVGIWGVRKPLTELDRLICDLLEKHAKGGSYDGTFGNISIVPLSKTGEFSFEITLEATKVNELLALGISGMQVVASLCLAGEVLVDGAQRLYAGNAINPTAPVIFTADQQATVETDLSVANPSYVGMSPNGYTMAKSDSDHGFYICFTFLPFRQEGGQRYILQEYCTYAAVPLGQIPEP